MSTTTTTDLQLPIEDLLRAGTAAAHENVEHSKGAVALTRGELDREEYVRFLIMLWNVYQTLESALEQHATNPVLNPTYNPPLLSRAPALLSDISHLLSHPLSSIQEHPLFASLDISSTSSTLPSSEIPSGLQEYVSRLASLAASPDPAPLLAHAYVRYLGDLSGGQVIKRRVQKAYGLEEDEGQGVRFYEFGKLGGVGEIANIGDMKKIKEWYRDGMNAGVGDDKDLKVTIVAEANKAFELNQALFASIRPPSSTPSASTPSTPTPEAYLGDPTSPTVPSSSNPHHAFHSSLKEKEKSKEIPIQILQTNGSGGGTGKSLMDETVSMASVLSFLIALGITHAVLTLGGFTGQKGWDKFEAVQEWIARLLV